jgi:D-3-phosphoglycerate dehydrogenase
MDIRTVDVAAASANGILVTRASAGFDAAVAELVIAMMVDLSRDLSANVAAYRTGQKVIIRMGRQLRGSTLGILGYGFIGRYLAELGLALGMEVLVHDPLVKIGDGKPRAAVSPNCWRRPTTSSAWWWLRPRRRI